MRIVAEMTPHSPKMTPKRSPKGLLPNGSQKDPKTIPKRRPGGVLEGVLKKVPFLISISAKMVPFGVPKRVPKTAPKRYPKRIKFQNCFLFRFEAHLGPIWGPKSRRVGAPELNKFERKRYKRESKNIKEW